MSGNAKKPKQQLHEFYQKHKLPAPHFQVLDAVRDQPPNQQTFICNLTLTAHPDPEKGFPQQIFQGEGRTKKASQDAAATVAVQFLKTQGILEATEEVPGSLWTAVTRVCTDQVCDSW